MNKKTEKTNGRSVARKVCARDQSIRDRKRDEDGGAAKTRAGYAHFADQFTPYADGDPIRGLFDFLGCSGRPYTYSDGVLWSCIRKEVDRVLGKRSSQEIQILDAGCGPGTWTIRLADYLEGKNRPYRITGLDLTPAFLEQAHHLHDGYIAWRGRKLNIVFEEGNLEKRLSYRTDQFDFSATGYTVLNHICKDRLPLAAGELLRVTRGRHMTIVKPPGGGQTAYVCDLTDVQECRQVGDRVVVVDNNGAEHTIVARPLSAKDLRELFEAQGGKVIDLFGIDLFATPILGRRRASCYARLPGEESVATDYFRRIDSAHCRDPEALNWANHLCAIVERRQQRRPSDGNLQVDGS